MRKLAFRRQLVAEISGELGVLGLVITCSQNTDLYSGRVLKNLAGYKSVGFTSLFTNTFRVVKHRFFNANQSVNLLFIPIVHTTYKGNYKTYKLITC